VCAFLLAILKDAVNISTNFNARLATIDMIYSIMAFARSILHPMKTAVLSGEQMEHASPARMGFTSLITSVNSRIFWDAWRKTQ
jgi:hypothetical protein